MKVVTSLSDAEVSQPFVVSIGNFDGLHLGHREILRNVVTRARELDVRSLVMTFSPHPIRVLAPDRAPRLISTFDQKVRLIENCGIDVLFLAHFDQAFSRLTPEEFVQRYLIDGFRALSVCVGGNFSFGYRQSGTIQTLQEFNQAFEIIEVPPVRVRGMLASSSRVRELVSAGKVSRACRLLGRWFEIEGNLVPGAGRGRTMSVPTLNLKPQNELIPKMGVYISRVSLDGRPFMESVTNIGVRPTFLEDELTIETFVLNQAVPEDTETARLHFLRRLRDETKFESIDALRRQIGRDVQCAERFFRFLKMDHAAQYPD